MTGPFPWRGGPAGRHCSAVAGFPVWAIGGLRRPMLASRDASPAYGRSSQGRSASLLWRMRSSRDGVVPSRGEAIHFMAIWLLYPFSEDCCDQQLSTPWPTLSRPVVRAMRRNIAAYLFRWDDSDVDKAISHLKGCPPCWRHSPARVLLSFHITQA